MRLILTMCACKHVQPLVSFPPGGLQGGLNMEPFFRRKEKVLIVMGATGTGKTKLAIDLATRFPAEIVNSDKMQVYKGLDIVTNKVSDEECHGVPHHLLGIIDPDTNFTADDFCRRSLTVIDSIVRRDRLPIIAGGSNSYIDALVNHDKFLRDYECRFLWVDASLEVLHSFVSERVERMVRAGLVDEVRKVFDPNQADYTRGIRRAIGVPEMDEYFRAEAMGAGERTKARLLRTAIARIKENTCLLARRQLQKIHRIHSQWGWHVGRLDATEAFLKRGDDREAEEAWDNLVAGPGTTFLARFLYGEGVAASIMGGAAAAAAGGPVPMSAAVAAAASR